MPQKKKQNVTLDPSKFSFKGTGKTLKDYKSKVQEQVDKIGSVVAETAATFTVKFDKKKITAPKSWFTILPEVAEFAKGGSTNKPAEEDTKKEFNEETFEHDAYLTIRSFFKEKKDFVEVWKNLSLRDKNTDHVYRQELSFKKVGGKLFEVVLLYYHGQKPGSVGSIVYNEKGKSFTYDFPMWDLNSTKQIFAEGGQTSSGKSLKQSSEFEYKGLTIKINQQSVTQATFSVYENGKPYTDEKGYTALAPYNNGALTHVEHDGRKNEWLATDEEIMQVVDIIILHKERRERMISEMKGSGIRADVVKQMADYFTSPAFQDVSTIYDFRRDTYDETLANVKNLFGFRKDAKFEKYADSFAKHLQKQEDFKIEADGNVFTLFNFIKQNTAPDVSALPDEEFEAIRNLKPGKSTHISAHAGWNEIRRLEDNETTFLLTSESGFTEESQQEMTREGILSFANGTWQMNEPGGDEEHYASDEFSDAVDYLESFEYKVTSNDPNYAKGGTTGSQSFGWGGTSVIGEKRAKDIAKYLVTAAEKENVQFPALKRFSEKGFEADNVFEPIMEMGQVNRHGSPVRLNYDDSVRLRDYFDQFLPTEIQKQVIKANRDKFDFKKGGRVSFNDKVSAIEKTLVGTKVSPAYKDKYGETYSKEDAHEAATKIAGAIVRDEGYARGGKIPNENILGIYNVEGKGVSAKIEIVGFEKLSANNYSLYQPVHGGEANTEIGSITIPLSAFTKISKGNTVVGTIKKGVKVRITRLGSSGDFSKEVADEFTIDDDKYYPGYHVPSQRWNGWATPAFEKDVALQILKDFKIPYELKGETISAALNYGEGMSEEEYEYDDVDPQQISVNGESKTVYGLGAYSWVWDEKSREYSNGGQTNTMNKKLEEGGAAEHPLLQKARGEYHKGDYSKHNEYLDQYHIGQAEELSANIPKYDALFNNPDVTVLVISSKAPLSSQLQRLTGDHWNALDFDGSPALGDLIIHKQTGKKFTAVNERQAATLKLPVKFYAKGGKTVDQNNLRAGVQEFNNELESIGIDFDDEDEEIIANARGEFDDILEKEEINIADVEEALRTLDDPGFSDEADEDAQERLKKEIAQLRKVMKGSIAIIHDRRSQHVKDMEKKGFAAGGDTETFGYADIVFMQDSEADEPLKILDEEGPDAAVKFLSNWDNGEYYDVSNMPRHGTSDRTHKVKDYILAYNTSIGYIGLYKKLKMVNGQWESIYEHGEKTEYIPYDRQVKSIIKQTHDYPLLDFTIRADGSYYAVVRSNDKYYQEQFTNIETKVPAKEMAARIIAGVEKECGPSKFEEGGDVIKTATGTHKKKILPDQYYKSFRLKGNGRREYTIFQSLDTNQRRQACHQLFPNMSYAEHKELAHEYAALRKKANKAYADTVDKWFLKEFGRKPEITDYKVSGIYTDDFSKEAKDAIRLELDKEGQYMDAAYLHDSLLKKADKADIKV